MPRAARWRRRLAAAGPAENLLPWVLVAAGAAMLLPRVAGALASTVLPALAVMVFGVGVTLEPAQVRSVLGRPRTILAALAVQWTVVPLAGIALARLAGDAVVAHGIEITAFAPAEITSVLIVMLAGGDAALGAAVMACSLLSGTVLTPLWVRWTFGGSARVSTGGLIVELVAGVALPFVGALALNARRFPRWPALSARGGDLSAAALVYVVFVGAGRARPIVASDRIVAATLLSLALLAVGLVAGRLVGRVATATAGDAAALTYPVAMREFGLATSVATLVAPESAAVTALYGIILMIVTPVLARRWRV